MVSLNPNGGSLDSGYYLIVKEITKNGYGKTTDVSAQNQIDILYWNQKDDSTVAGEVSEIENYIEGSVKKVFINQYERNPKARQACIEYYGSLCQICSFDFSEKYGVYGEGYIEVHHIKPLSEIKESYVLDPVKDLIPVCSNCHSILHRGKNPIAVEELKFMFTM